MESKKEGASALVAQWRAAARDWVALVWGEQRNCVRHVYDRFVLLPPAVDQVQPARQIAGYTWRSSKRPPHVFGRPPKGVPYLLPHWTVKIPVFDDLPERVATDWSLGATGAGETLATASEKLAASISPANDASVLLELAGTFSVMGDEDLRQFPTREQAEAYQRAERWVTTYCARQVVDAAHAERVSYLDAINGRVDIGLPPTPKSTLRRWIQNPQSASDLGVNPKGSIVAQQPLVGALIKRHAMQSIKRRPPQPRKK